MAKDSKLPHIECKVSRDQISTDQRKLCADRLKAHWGEVDTFKEFTELYPPDEESEEGVSNPSASLYRDVYNEYFGPVDDSRTVEELRAQYGSITEYIEARKHGNVDLDTNELTDSELEKYKEGVREGYRAGYKDGLADAQDEPEHDAAVNPN